MPLATTGGIVVNPRHLDGVSTVPHQWTSTAQASGQATSALQQDQFSGSDPRENLPSHGAFVNVRRHLDPRRDLPQRLDTEHLRATEGSRTSDLASGALTLTSLASRQ